jgi:sulfoxide reductase heme-binding subunit YedZ
VTVTWYVVRASGVLAFVFLTVSVVVGLLLSGRVRAKRWPRFALEDVHGFAGVLAGVFIGVHGFALLIDRYVPFSLAQLVVPGMSSYRPLATACGVVAAELLAALAVTNRVRRQLPPRFWRRAHYLNFAVWSLALAHGIAAGTDAGTLGAGVLYTLGGGTVAGFTVWRALTPSTHRRRLTEISQPS